MISAHTALCSAIPASKTTQHGQLGPGYHRLQADAPGQPPTRGLSTMHQGLGYLGVRARRDPPLRCGLGADQASALRTVRPQWSARPPSHPLRGCPGAPTTHRIGWDGHAAPVPQGRTTPMTTPPQEQTTGLGHAAPVGTTPHSNTCTILVLPSTIKGEDLGHLEEGRTPCNTHTRTHLSRLRATSQTTHTTPCQDLGLAPSLPSL